MTREFLLWSGVLLQGTGLAVLTLCGAFGRGGDGSKGRPAFLRACSLPPCLAGAAVVAVFALLERHLLLAAAEAVAVVLVCLGLPGGKRGSHENGGGR